MKWTCELVNGNILVTFPIVIKYPPKQVEEGRGPFWLRIPEELRQGRVGEEWQQEQEAPDPTVLAVRKERAMSGST